MSVSLATRRVSAVTGAAGFVGGALVRRLLAEGDEIRALVLPGDGGAEDLRALGRGTSRLRVVEGDVCDTASLAAAFEGVERVFHAAALVHAWAPASRFRAVNVEGTRNVAEVALAHGVSRLVAISTTDVFGLPRGDEVFDEGSPLRPWGEPYADTKIEAEQWLWRFARDSGMPLSIVYPGWVYGPGDRAFFPALAQAMASGAMFFWSRGVRLPLVYVDNLVDACVLASELPVAAGRGYIVFDTQTLAFEDLCARIAAAIGVSPPRLRVPYALAHAAAGLLQALWRVSRRTTPPPLLTVDVKAFGMQWHFNNARARAELGWRPRISLDEGLRLALADLVRRQQAALDIFAPA